MLRFMQGGAARRRQVQWQAAPEPPVRCACGLPDPAGPHDPASNMAGFAACRRRLEQAFGEAFATERRLHEAVLARGDAQALPQWREAQDATNEAARKLADFLRNAEG